MLVVMQAGAKPSEIEAVVRVIQEMGYEARPMPGAQRTAVGLVGNDGRVDASRIEALAGVAQVIHVTQPYKQVSREWKPESTIVAIGDAVRVGANEVVVIAGPCSVESEEQIVTAARQVRAAGASCLRGGAFKPRSSPYSFQGLGKKGLELLALARRETGLAIVTEAMDEEGAEHVAEYADCIQIGARNMQNYSLLKFVGSLDRPVLLKRGLAATIQELLLSAEYVLAAGNPNVILCERGVRTFDTATRNMFDLTAIPIVQQLSHLPIIADPSHGTGIRDKVIPMARAAVAAGAHGVMVEQIPGRYRVTFTQPKGDRIISDGKMVWLYLPSTNPGQVMKVPVREGGNGVPDFTAFLLNAPKDRFALADGAAATVSGRPAHTVLLTPKVGGIPFIKARVWVDDADGLVRQFETIDINGGVRRVRVESIDMNVPVDASLFTFTVPSGVRVIDASGLATT